MAKIVLVGEAWGADEEIVGHPFVGSSGAQLLLMLDQTGLLALTPEDRINLHSYFRFKDGAYTAAIWRAHSEIFVTNTFNVKPQPTNDIKNLCGTKAEGIKGMPYLQSGKYVLAKYEPELRRLEEELNREKPNVVVALGATPAWALLLTSGIKAIRGAATQSRWGWKVVPTWHPAAMLRDWSLRPVILADLTKAKREAEYPDVRRPHRDIWIEPTLSDLWDFADQFIKPSSFLSIDIENIGPMIEMIGFSPDPAHALVVPFFDPRQKDGNYWRTASQEKAAWYFCQWACSLQKRIVFQNGLYDMNHLWRTQGITVPWASDDTMLLHHAMQPELEKGLGFLGTIYTDEASWKFMREKGKTLKREQ